MKQLFLFLFFLCLACQPDQSNTATTPSEKATQKNETSNSTIEVPATTSGIQFNNILTESPQLNRLNYEYFYNGGGVAIGDINNDGLADIYFTGNMVPDKLYLNQGNLKFKDITGAAGIPFENDWHTGVAMADVNADGWLDIYVSRSGWFTDKAKKANRLYINNQDNTFTEAAASYGLADTGLGVQAAFFDGDMDGDLDVFVLNNPEAKPNAANLIEYRKQANSGNLSTDRYYENRNGKFVDQTKNAGLLTFGYRHGISVGDLNNDGWPDIYLSSDFDDPDYLFINDGDGSYTNRIDEMMDQISMFSMGNDQADINHDGFFDLFVADMTPGNHERSKQNMASMNPAKFYGMAQTGFHHQYMINTLQLNNGGQSFSNISHMAGLANTDWSWSTLFLDWDMDGNDDLFVTNGIKRDVLNNDVRIKATKLMQQQQRQPEPMQVLNLMPSNKIKNYFYQNDGDLGFLDKTPSWIGNRAYNSNGAAYGDLDNDGDLDLVINNVEDPANLLENKSKNNYIKIKISGGSKNPFGIGTRVKVYAEGKVQMKELFPNRGFCSSMEPILHFGLGQTNAIDKVEVIHSNKTGVTIENPTINKLLNVSLDGVGPMSNNLSTSPLFASLAPGKLGLNYVHKENNFDDFAKETLLPQRYSQNGPFMSTADVNGDALTDLFVGGASGQPGTLFIQSKQGKFTKKTIPVFSKDASHEDMKSVFFDADGDGDNDLYVVSGGYEQQDGSPYYQDRLYLNDGKGNFKKKPHVANIRSSGQALALADIDQDGDLDIFRGGRVMAGEYPQTAPSFILINEDGRFTNRKNLDITGLITDAVFNDINGDGKDELFVCGEWMSPTYYSINAEGDISNPTTLGTKGWYQSLFIDDLNGDGNLDLIAGNMGENNKFHPNVSHPLHVYAADFDENGTNDIILSKMYKGHNVPVRGRECSSQQLPFIQEKFPTFKEFAEASLEDVYGDKLADALHHQVESMAHFSCTNLASTKNAIALPKMTQRSPLMDIVQVSINNQSYLIGAGNHYHTEVETSRYDAGIGVVLSMKGNELQTVPAIASGLMLDGDIKDLEVIQLANGKTILVATQNNGPFKIFQVNS